VLLGLSGITSSSIPSPSPSMSPSLEMLSVASLRDELLLAFEFTKQYIGYLKKYRIKIIPL
jgi:hypothetical protein